MFNYFRRHHAAATAVNQIREIERFYEGHALKKYIWRSPYFLGMIHGFILYEAMHREALGPKDYPVVAHHALRLAYGEYHNDISIRMQTLMIDDDENFREGLRHGGTVVAIRAGYLRDEDFDDVLVQAAFQQSETTRQELDRAFGSTSPQPSPEASAALLTSYLRDGYYRFSHEAEDVDFVMGGGQWK